MKRASNKELRDTFRKFNMAYFGGTLPDIPVTFDAEELEPSDWGLYTTDDRILIADCLRYIDFAWQITLLHEMAHLACPFNGHGLQWSSTINKLIECGAYDHLL